MGAIAFSEGYLGEFPTKIQEVPIRGSDIKATFDYSIPKRKGRPKGSKNKPKELLSGEGISGDDPIIPIQASAAGMGIPWWDEDTPDHVSILLQSEQVPDGLEAVVSRFIAVAVSALPNGNASVITNIGSAQPLILVTAEPYEGVKKKFFPGAK